MLLSEYRRAVCRLVATRSAIAVPHYADFERSLFSFKSKTLDVERSSLSAPQGLKPPSRGSKRRLAEWLSLHLHLHDFPTTKTLYTLFAYFRSNLNLAFGHWDRRFRLTCSRSLSSRTSSWRSLFSLSIVFSISVCMLLKNMRSSFLTSRLIERPLSHLICTS